MNSQTIQPLGKFQPSQLTIWGRADTLEKIADGIFYAMTPSHGGYIISTARLGQMKPEYRACSFTKDNHFEEDCSWCAVVLSWPEFFTDNQYGQALATYNCLYAKRRA